MMMIIEIPKKMKFLGVKALFKIKSPKSENAVMVKSFKRMKRNEPSWSVPVPNEVLPQFKYNTMSVQLTKLHTHIYETNIIPKDVIID